MRGAALAALAILLAVLVAGVDRGSSLPEPGGLIRVHGILERQTVRDPSVKVFRIESRTGKRIGWAVTRCRFIGSGGVLGGSGTELCDGTYNFPLGRIMVLGARRRGGFSYLLAVVGGTGYYSDVGGSLFVERTAPRTERLLFSLESF